MTSSRKRWLIIAGVGVVVVVLAVLFFRGKSSSTTATTTPASSTTSGSGGLGLSTASSLENAFTHEIQSLTARQAAAARSSAASTANLANEIAALKNQIASGSTKTPSTQGAGSSSGPNMAAFAAEVGRFTNSISGVKGVSISQVQAAAKAQNPNFATASFTQQQIDLQNANIGLIAGANSLRTPAASALSRATLVAAGGQAAFARMSAVQKEILAQNVNMSMMEALNPTRFNKAKP